ncbi:MAG: bis-aminopropyl spermidine synthase family protein [Myxococcota bacterium]
MYEGAFRILRVLGDGKSRPRDVLARDAGEAASVVREVLERYPKWFEPEGNGVRCSDRGLAALAREMVARGASRSPDTSWREAYEALAASRGRPKRELDQVYVTTDTAIRRAELLIENGEHQRGLVFVGDDDLTSAAVQWAGAGRRVTAVDTDDDVLRVLRQGAEAHGWDLATTEHDLRDPWDRSMTRRFGAVFTDPPYAVEGFALFVSRSIELLKPDGRLYVCFGHSRRASERGLQKQRVLSDAGLLIESVSEGFNKYEGAESIGAQSALWRCRMTPESKPVVTGRVDGPLYTSRSTPSPR